MNTKTETNIVDNYRLTLRGKDYVPIMIGGMGVDISTADLALEAARLGGIGHISDAMALQVSDKRYGSKFTKAKSEFYKGNKDNPDKTGVKFDLEALYQAQFNHVKNTMDRKKGPGAVFVNTMEKLGMGAPMPTLKARLQGSMDAGVDGITLSAGLHTHSLGLIADHPKFHEVNIGIIVSSVRALKIFMRGAKRAKRNPDYIIVEGPLAGGHLGFGNDWKTARLKDIVVEVLDYLAEGGHEIPVIPAGGVFTGTDAAEYLEMGCGAVQVATRFTITKECGFPPNVKQKYLKADEENVVVNTASPTGYLMRMLDFSPCLNADTKPMCEPFGYTLDKNGQCQYLTQYHSSEEEKAKLKESGETAKMCLCYHFSKHNCYTCGHYVYRLKDTTTLLPDGNYYLPDAEQIFKDYQFSANYEINVAKPKEDESVVKPAEAEVAA